MHGPAGIFWADLTPSSLQRKEFVDAVIAGHTGNRLQPLVQLIAALLKNAWAELDRLRESRGKTRAKEVQEKAVKDHRAAVRLALGVKVVPTPPCIFH
jgi:hypothetical protein